MFCILLNIIAACSIITQIHSFYPNPWMRMTVRLCREIRGNPLRDVRETTETKLYMSRSPFILKKNTTSPSTKNTTKTVYVTYDTVLWENGELAWDLPDEKNTTDNSSTTNVNGSGPYDPSGASDILRILGLTPSKKNTTTINYI